MYEEDRRDRADDEKSFQRWLICQNKLFYYKLFIKACLDVVSILGEPCTLKHQDSYFQAWKNHVKI